MLGASSTDIQLTRTRHLTGPTRRVGHNWRLHTPAHIGRDVGTASARRRP